MRGWGSHAQSFVGEELGFTKEKVGKVRMPSKEVVQAMGFKHELGMVSKGARRFKLAIEASH